LHPTESLFIFAFVHLPGMALLSLKASSTVDRLLRTTLACVSDQNSSQFFSEFECPNADKPQPKNYTRIKKPHGNF